MLWAGDPGPEIESERRVRERAIQDDAREREAAEHQEALALGHRQRHDQLQPLLAEAALLDPPVYADDVVRLEAELEDARSAAAEVERTREAAEVLRSGLEALRELPPDEAQVAALRRRLEAIEARRTTLFHVDQGLGFVRERREALDWGDAQARLVSERRLVPELTEAEAEASRRVEAAREAEGGADGRWQAAVEQLQAARGQATEIGATVAAAEQELAEIGVGAPLAADVEAAAERCTEAERTHNAVQVERDEVAGRHARCGAERERAVADAAEKAERLTAQTREARPHEERWQRLERLAAEHEVLGPARARFYVEAFTGLGSPNLSTRARVAGSQLAERLRGAQRAEEVLDAVQDWIGGDEDRSAEGYLGIWRQVLEWLRRRLPAHIADVADPLEAFRRLSAELASLEEHLQGQETQLRGASADVASHIEVQLRKAVGQVQRLNRHLQGVHFGSVEAIRVRWQRIESMSRILGALREEEPAQALLFDPGLPFEEALDRLFDRYGGGGAGGQRILDYREYLDLHVEVRRRGGREWEPASATRLSTGEAIGVGAAVMMVVLAEWERDANLLRGKKRAGSVRFLFLDEANRLDRGNLDEIFELCGTLELQLLIAAPEVARAAGITTYHLERVVDGEEVRVLATGRRARAAS